MPEKVKATWTHYRNYGEMTQLLQDLAAAYPDLASVYSLGQSYQGRELWCIEITNKATGPGCDKPGFQIDGNTHAGEVTGCEVALYDAHYLLSRYGDDDFATGLVDTRVIYIIPRIGVDAAEHCLSTPYNNATSSMRPYPLSEAEWLQTDGLYSADVDGDGDIVQMRYVHPEGEWKVSSKDSRIMLRRNPGDAGGPFYRLLPEGLLHNYTGGPIRSRPPRYGLNFNRNWPANWAVTEDGSGPFPLSEPETRAMADFWRAHPNICGVMTYHTFSGVIIRTYVTKPDSAFPREDLAAYEAIGRLGSEITGYKSISVYEDFTPAGSEPRHGNSKDWWYEHLGVHVFCIELWSMAREAGVEVEDYFAFLGARSEEDELKLLAYNDGPLGGRGFKPWTSFDHPQLGKVEVGGWRYKFTFQNPPRELLREEIERTFLFGLKHASLSPLVKVAGLAGRDLGDGTWELEATVRNDGWLPTYITRQAINLGIARPVVARLQLPDGCELVAGRVVTDLGHLKGRWSMSAPWGMPLPPETEAVVRWVIRTPNGGGRVRVAVETVSQKGGRSEAECVLG